MTQSITILAKVTPKSRRPSISLNLLPAQAGNPSSGTAMQAQIKVRAAASDGAANKEAIEALAHHIGIPKSKIRLKSGHTSRHKVFLVDEVDMTKLIVQLPLC